MTDRLAVVTGAGSGIGRATALRLARDGARVVAISRRPEPLRELAAEPACAGRVVPVALDVTDRDRLRDRLAEAAAQHGSIDVLVPNAGIELHHGPSIADVSDEDWDRLLAVNLTGAMATLRAAIPHLRDGASVVVVGSVASLIAFANDAPYAASKAAVLQLARAAALELAGRGVRVNSVLPAAIETAMVRGYWERAADGDAARAATVEAVPLGRMGTPDEVAAAIAWLCSEEAAFVTGSQLVIDGGLLTERSSPGRNRRRASAR